MNIKKIIKGTLLSSFVYITISLVTNKVLPEDIAITVFNTLNKTNILVISIMSGITYLLCSYRLPIIPDNDIPVKKFEYFYSQCDSKLKKELDTLSKEEKLKYVESTEAILPQNKKNDLNNYVFTLKTPQKSKLTKILGKFSIILLISYTGYISYQIYNDTKPFIDEYNEELSATYDDQILYIDSLPPIQLNGDNTLNKKRVDTFIRDKISTQNYLLLATCSSIMLSSQERQDSFWYEHHTENESRAFTNGNIIYIRLSDSLRTITHELSHTYDFIYSCSTTNEFQNLYMSYKGTFKFPEVNDDYCNNDSAEFFAESSQLYVNNPDYLEKSCKPLYDYFSNLYS